MTDVDDPTEPEVFDAEPILAVLDRHGVEYVIVGGYAARVHGSTRPTRDVDVTPATTQENLDRLAAALRELDARIRTDAVPDGLPFSTSGRP
ncbi:nucleotidyltransferase domain-containing protein [Klenkia terrae]|uniref:nucleotidyltransferase domain-containing protein n=1 Tax=Klenkia terrae TaxID=1052259 RepID=UPI00361A61E3